MDVSDFLAPVDDNFLCTICQSVMVSPSACSQGHQFCRECIETRLQETPTCPERCGDLAIGSLTTVRSVENLINKLQVRCCHADLADGPSPGPQNFRCRSRAHLASSKGAKAGCEWVGSVQERVTHLQVECTYSEAACSCAGCDAKVLRFELAEHEASCEHREVSCEKCDERLKAWEMSDHLQVECLMVEFDCPQGCGATVLRRDLGEHEKECSFVVVSCSFAEHGCSEHGKRKNIRKHEEEAVEAHARLVARRAGLERERAARLEEEVTKLTQSLHQSKSVVLKLENKLEESKLRVKTLEKELVAERQSSGETSVTWTIEDLMQKAEKKERVRSKVFHVHAKACEYHLRLSLRFFRKHGSTKHGYVGLFVEHASEDGGSTNFPVSLEGTELRVEEGEGPRQLNAEDQLDRDGSWGVDNMMSTDTICDLSWTEEDPQARAGVGEPEHDVTDLLDDDTLTIEACIRITPVSAVEI